MSEGMWDYQGVLLPRGVTVHSRASETDLRRLELVASARAAGRADGGGAIPRRAFCDSEYLQGFCELLQAHGFDAMGTATFSDRVAYSRFILSPLRAVQVVSGSIVNETPLRGSRGFRGKLFVTPEWHRTGRAVPHIHFALATTGNPEGCCAAIRSHLSDTFGRSTCEVMRDQTAGTLYGLKDTLKETACYPNAFYLSLRPHGRRG